MDLLKQASYNTLGNVFSSFAQWLIIMILPKMSNYSETGILSAAISICSVLNIIATLQLNQYQVTNYNKQFVKNDFLSTRCATILLTYLISIIISICLNYELNQIYILLAYLTYRNILHLSYIYTSELQLDNMLNYVGKCMMLEGLVSFIAFIITYVYSLNLVISVFSMAFVGGGTFYLSVILKYRHIHKRLIKFKLNFINTLKLIKIGIPLSIAAIIPLIINAIPKILLQSFWDNELLGIFSTISSPTIIFPILAISIFTPFIPHLSEMYNNKNIIELSKTINKLIVFEIIGGSILILISTPIAYIFFTKIYGNIISAHILEFTILLIGMLFYCITQNNNIILMIIGHKETSAQIGLIFLILSVITLTIMIQNNGILGSSIGLFVIYVLYAIITSIYINNNLKKLTRIPG